jgi:outer membrane protein assembly factor BamB
MWRDRLIVQLDQATPDDEVSALYAFNAADGAVAWKTARPVGASWATPIVIEAAGKPQIVTLAMPWAISYAPETGKEIWRADCMDGEVTPSPVFAAGMLFAVNPSNKLLTIRADGEGDVTATHLGWSAEDGVPDVTSPVANGQLVFMVDAAGMLSCYDMKDGAKQWEHDLGEPCHASPSIAGERLVLITKSGTVILCAVAKEFRQVGRFSVGEEVFASPAFARERMFVRGVKSLICVGRSSR